MTERREKSVFFVGQQERLDEAFRNISLSPEVRTYALPYGKDCAGSLTKENCALLVFDFDGDAAGALNLLAELEQSLPQTPKLALVDHGDIPTAVQAIKAGAGNCLEKPVDPLLLRSEIDAVLGQTDRESIHRTSGLTPTEKAVLDLILDGKTTHEVARDLHRSPRTIEVHRKHIMHKLGVSNIVQLVKTAMSIGLCET